MDDETFKQHIAQNIQSIMEKMAHYDQISDYIIMRLIHLDNNKTELLKCPHVPMLDLAVTFRVLLHDEEGGVGTISINHRQFYKWGITMERLYETALKNTVTHLPCQFENLQQIVENLTADKGEQQLLNPEPGDMPDVYHMSNVRKAYGAVCILYPRVLKQCADRMDSDLYILPTSVHEVLLIPESSGMQVNNLKAMLWEGNRTLVTAEEKLSDNVYHYSRREDKISIT